MVARLIAIAVIGLFALPSIARAQLRAELIASGLSSPVAFVPDPAVPGVSYIVQQGGIVRVLRDGVLQAAPFADLRPLITFGGEQGLLGMAFPPNAATTGRVFFYYVDTNGNIVISRYQRTAANPFAIVPTSRLDLLWPGGQRFIPHPTNSNHNGGNLMFGPDGYLYAGIGDGGAGNDPPNNAQNPNVLLGKMLRIDVNVPDSDTGGYRVPPDNPFLDGQPILALGEIWAFGLRNPWRFSFDDFGTGATGGMFVGDVGQSAREEINGEPAGAGGRNYGWAIREGLIPSARNPPPAPAYLPLTDPIFDLNRSVAQSITGGYVYRGAALGSAYQGRYFFADFILSRVYSFLVTRNPSGEFVATDAREHTAELGGASFLSGVASFARDFQGELYLVTFGGRVLRMALDTTTPPNPPSNIRFVVSGTTVTLQFSAPASGPTATHYRLDAGTAPGAANIGSVFTPAAQTLLTFVGVPPGTYFARLYSYISVVVGAASPEQTITVTGTCNAVPPAPLTLGHALAGRVVTLVWDMASTTNGPVTFDIEAGSATGLGNLAVLVVDGVTRSFTVAAPPGQYFVRIRGRNGCGLGAVSNEIIVTVP